MKLFLLVVCVLLFAKGHAYGEDCISPKKMIGGNLENCFDKTDRHVICSNLLPYTIEEGKVELEDLAFVEAFRKACVARNGCYNAKPSGILVRGIKRQEPNECPPERKTP